MGQAAALATKETVQPSKQEKPTHPVLGVENLDASPEHPGKPPVERSSFNDADAKKFINTGFCETETQEDPNMLKPSLAYNRAKTS